jgi:hypothetical protein
VIIQNYMVMIMDSVYFLEHYDIVGGRRIKNFRSNNYSNCSRIYKSLTVVGTCLEVSETFPGSGASQRMFHIQIFQANLQSFKPTGPDPNYD